MGGFPSAKLQRISHLSRSIVHNIVKRFRESGEILVRKGQGRKPLMNARDHRALRRYCLRNRHATMMDIATWAQEYFGKSLSLNTVHRCIKKCNLKLYYAKRKAFIKFVHWNAIKFSGPEVIWDGPKDSGNMFSGQRSPRFNLFLGKTDVRFYVLKMKVHPDSYQRKVQKPTSVMGGCISVHSMGDICEVTIDVDCSCGWCA